MDSESGYGWTRMFIHTDTGNQRLAQNKWDAAITTAADAGIQRRMFKTYISASSSSPAGSTFENGPYIIALERK